MKREGEGFHHESVESREAVLQRSIDAFREFSVRAKGADRAHALSMQYFLRSVLREEGRPLGDAVTVLYQKLDLKGVSEEFKKLVSKTAVEIGAVFSHGGDRIVLPSVIPQYQEVPVDPDTTSDEVLAHGPVSVTQMQRGARGDMFSFDPLDQLHVSSRDVHDEDELVRQKREELQRAKRVYYARVFASAREYAQRYIERAIPKYLDAEQLAERVGDLEHTLLECDAHLYEHFGFPATCIRNSPNEEFFIEYFAAVQAAGTEVHELDSKINDYIGTRARLGVLLNRVSDSSLTTREATPEQILGVNGDAKQEEIEQKYLLRLQALDPDREGDAASIQMLHAARDRALQRFENAISSVPPMSHRIKDESDEGFLSRTLRAPGKLLRMMFGVAALGGVGIAVHQFAENDSEEPKVVDVAPEDDKVIDLSGFETASTPTESSQFEKKAEGQLRLIPSSLRWDKDSIWRVMIDMLRDRGLSTSNTQVTYYTHQAMVDNHLDEEGAKHLKVGDPLNFTHVAELMDAAAGMASHVEGPAALSQPSDQGDSGASAEGVSSSQRDTSLRGFGSGSSDDWVFDSAPAIEQSPVFREDVKPYSLLPTVYEKTHCMVKGESIYKIVHNMLRARGLNWTTERINFLTQLVVDRNVDRFREMVADGRMRKMDDVWIPAGAVLDFSDAVAVVDDMERAKQAGKKAKTVKELANANGYKYPIMMKFPKE